MRVNIANPPQMAKRSLNTLRHHMDANLPTVRKRGRRSLRTPERAAAIADALGRGLAVSAACAIAGIGTRTFHTWRNNNVAFQDQIEEAISRGIDNRLKRIEAASDSGDWRASAWLLEHTTDMFSKQRVVESVSYTQNNFTIPKELLDLIATTRRQHEKVITETSGD